MTDDSNITVTPSSGNVFADLGLADEDNLLVKANLAIHISSAIKMRKLTQAQAAKILRIDQPKVSPIIRTSNKRFRPRQSNRSAGGHNGRDRATTR